MAPSLVPTEVDVLQGLIADDLFGGSAAKGVGLEAEMFAHRIDGTAFDLRRESPRILEAIARELGGQCIHETESGPRIILDDGGTITLEPAGQLEYSGRPFADHVDAVQDTVEHIHQVDVALRRIGLRVELAAYDSRRADPPLVVTKPRYQAMDAYFERIGPFGRMMMRRTCALQINVDFGASGIERWRLANMITPALNALFANSQHDHGGETFKSFRYEIWRRADPTRTGRFIERPEADPSVEYTRFALDAGVMMARRGDAMLIPPPHMTFRRWMSQGWEGDFPGVDDWQRHLGTLFPDVRPKGWMEIRAVDAQPLGMIGPVVAMTVAVLSDSSLRGRLLDRLQAMPRRGCSVPDDVGIQEVDLATGVGIARLAAEGVDHAPYRRALVDHIERVCSSRGLQAVIPKL